ncbi:hypothetical protein AABB24_030783 [Solanum stoloniferum]|uniref:Uncharacterized protein n=1 Tax=Solanum stoloniferum TaxID=62892 RepID=A0ABD2RQQ5_9SOLN
MNKILLTGCDARIFCFGVRLVRRRTLVHILNIIPKEPDGEAFDDALACIRRCIGGGTATENADSDSDLEVVADFITVNLRCPLQTCGEEVSEIEVKPNDSWRAKAEGDQRSIGDLGRWHLPDGTLIESQDIESKPKPGILKHVIQEGGSESCGLKVGLKKNRNGLWQINKPEDMQTFPQGDGVRENVENHIQDIIPMSSSATVSGKEGENPSVNQDGLVNFDFPTNGFELETILPNFVPAYGRNDRNPPAPARGAELIVLSDSDEENEPFISSASIYNDNHTNAPVVSFAGRPKGISASCHDNWTLVNDGNSCLGLFNANDDEFVMNMWPLPTVNQGPQAFSYLVQLCTRVLSTVQALPMATRWLQTLALDLVLFFLNLLLIL